MSTKSLTVLPKELTGLRPTGSYSFDELFRLAQVCHASGLFDDVTDAAQAMVKIVKGQEMGLPPTTAMGAFDLIRKRLFIKPWVIAALINACGYGRYRVVAQSDQACTIHFARKYPGQGWLECPPVTYTIAEAKAHGLLERSVHWKASPAHMLYQRCMGRGGARYFPELLAGLTPPQEDMPITPEQHQQNLADLFGDQERGPSPVQHTSPDERDASKEPQTAISATADTQVVSEANVGHSDAKNRGSWRDTIEELLIDTDGLQPHIPHELYEACMTAFHGTTVTDEEGEDLVATLRQWAP